jgi:hypothetical protein
MGTEKERSETLLKQEIVRMTGGLVWYKMSTQTLRRR